jgi:hypothetical protein
VIFSKDVKQLRPIPQKFIKKYLAFKLMKITLPLLYTERERYREERGERETEKDRDRERERQRERQRQKK